MIASSPESLVSAQQTVKLEDAEELHEAHHLMPVMFNIHSVRERHPVTLDSLNTAEVLRNRVGRCS
jgi:hypothetical protein